MLFSKRKPRTFTSLTCLVLVYSVLLLTLFSGNSWNAWWDWRHVRASSWCHISSLVIIFFLLFINSEELIYFQISKVLRLNSQTQFIMTFTFGVCKILVIVISGLTFEWGMLFRSKIQWCHRDFIRQTVRLLCWSACRCWLGHFNWINSGGSATLRNCDESKTRITEQH